MTTRTYGLAVMFAVTTWGAGVAAQDAGAPSGARRWIQTRHGAVNRLLERPATPARNTQVARILDGMLDLTELARQALTPYWEQRSAQERTDFVDLLRQLIERNYQQNLDHTLNFDVTYEPEVPEAGTAMVTERTVARSRTDPRAALVRVDYKMHPSGANWVVTDIVTNGASLVQSYHDSYTRIIREHGFPELLTRMRSRIAQMATTPDGGTATP